MTDDNELPYDYDVMFGLLLGQVLLGFRRRANLGQREVVAATRMSQSSLSRIEAGTTPDVLQFRRLCAALGVEGSHVLDTVDVAERHARDLHKPGAALAPLAAYAVSLATEAV